MLGRNSCAHTSFFPSSGEQLLQAPQAGSGHHETGPWLGQLEARPRLANRVVQWLSMWLSQEAPPLAALAGKGTPAALANTPALISELGREVECCLSDLLRNPEHHL